MAKAQESAAVSAKVPPKNVVDVGVYCSIRGLNKLDTIVFKNVAENAYRHQRFTLEEWDAKREEFYSRKA